MLFRLLWIFMFGLLLLSVQLSRTLHRRTLLNILWWRYEDHDLAPNTGCILRWVLSGRLYHKLQHARVSSSASSAESAAALGGFCV